MLASGGLGIAQKPQQKSAYAEEKSTFLLIAFIPASGISFLIALLVKGQGAGERHQKKLAVASCVGLLFGCCNLLNTSLAGMLDSAFLFPTRNISVILLSMLCGIIFFKEKISEEKYPF